MDGEDEITLRRPLFSCFVLTLAAGFWLAFCIMLVVGRDDVWVGMLIFSPACAFFWALGWGNAVRYTPTHLSITNGLVTSRVAWTDVQRVSGEDGLTIHLADSRVMGSIQYGGSVLGEITGYPTYRSAVEALTAAHLEATGGRRVPPGYVHVEEHWWWRPPLLATALFLASFLPALVLHRLV